MTQQEILEYNKRCAEFLGYINRTPDDKDFDFYEKKDGVLGRLLEPMSMKFHSDWNWIMKVCISLGMEFVTTNKEQLIQAINQFLIWYEQNKTV